MSFNSDKQLLDYIEDLEATLRALKIEVHDAGENNFLAASAVLNGQDPLLRQLHRLSGKASGCVTRAADDLFDFLLEYRDTSQRDAQDAYWGRFLDKLEALRGTCCGHRGFWEVDYVDSDEWTQQWDLSKRSKGQHLISMACERNPPAAVVRTLLEITDATREVRRAPVQHIACAPTTLEYPLLTFMRSGGSVDVLKLLVGVDDQGVTLAMMDLPHLTSPYHLLVDKIEHWRGNFSEILRLFIRTDVSQGLALISKDAGGCLPVERMWKWFKIYRMSVGEILRDADFVSLLRATCYSHESMSKGMKDRSIDKPDTFENIPISWAFIVCSPCFHWSDVDEACRMLLPLANDFLSEKDSDGNFLIHRLIKGDTITVNIFDTLQEEVEFQLFTIERLLESIPQCAQLRDSEGRLPLHVAADLQQGLNRLFSGDGDRSELIQLLSGVYPEAVVIQDRITGLPPFALAARRRSCGRTNQWDKPCRGISLSSAFHLLRQSPEILSNLSESSPKVNKSGCSKTTTQPVKRPRIE